MATVPPKDARTIAQDQFDYYYNQAHNAKLCNDITEILLLVATASTTLAAALKAIPVVTALLAAFSFILVGLRARFNFKETWVRSGAASVQVLNAMDSYDTLPQEGKDQAAKNGLVAKVNMIRERETQSWAAQYKGAGKRHS